MANFSHLFLFVVLLLVPQVLAITNHIVGDESGWNTGVDYFSWTIGKTFFVGDNLVFKYEKKIHNVIEVNVSTFAQCSTPTDQQPLDTGNDVVPLLLPGTHWFICTIGHHCNSGQKLILSVDNPPPPSDIPQPSPPPSSSLPPTALPPLLPPFPIPPMPAAPSPSLVIPIISPPQNKSSPQPSSRPVPTPTENIPPSQSPAPTPTAPPPSRAAEKSPLSAHILGFLAVAVSVLAGIMI